MDTVIERRNVAQQDFEARALSWRTGSEVIGLDLSDEASISDAVIERLRSLLGERCILLFRNQSLTHDQHLAFTRRFGPLAVTGAIGRHAPPGYPDLFTVSNVRVAGVRPETANSARQWHSDQCFHPAPAMGSLLYCVEAPAFGGDTMFANMYQAWEGLSPGLQRTLGANRAVHDPFNTNNEALKTRKPFTEEERKTMQTVVHPLALRHPVTGKAALYCSEQMVDHFEGWSIEESKPMLDFLHRHTTQPAYTYRHHWRPGDLVFWDNRCTNHFAPEDYDVTEMDAPENRRLMHRSTLAGAPPTPAFPELLRTD